MDQSRAGNHISCRHFTRSNTTRRQTLELPSKWAGASCFLTSAEDRARYLAHLRTALRPGAPPSSPRSPLTARRNAAGCRACAIPLIHCYKNWGRDFDWTNGSVRAITLHSRLFRNSGTSGSPGCGEPERYRTRTERVRLSVGNCQAGILTNANSRSTSKVRVAEKGGHRRTEAPDPIEADAEPWPHLARRLSECNGQTSGTATSACNDQRFGAIRSGGIRIDHSRTSD